MITPQGGVFISKKHIGHYATYLEMCNKKMEELHTRMPSFEDSERHFQVFQTSAAKSFKCNHKLNPVYTCNPDYAELASIWIA